MNKTYIIGASAIGAQPVFDRETPEHVVAYDKHPLCAIMPDLSRYIPPMKSRRMTRIVRLGIMSGMNAMERAAVTSPGAIIVGTGDGCKHSTERFLTNMIEHDEQVPDPTAFIGSTHNSVAGQIALAAGSNVYNYTYLHRGLSFTSALLDGMLHLQEGTRNILVGAVDVITTDFITTQKLSGLWKQEVARNLDVLHSTDRGALAGEGSAFFVLDSEPRGASSVEVLSAELFFDPNCEGLESKIMHMVSASQRKVEEVDLLVLGYNGDAVEDRAYDRVRALFPNAAIAAYKHLTGEYYTANAQGAWFTWSALENGSLPVECMLPAP
ncbi:MAG: beta-ketoacyl synthase chain length factor [Flavobacteriales bacterium]|nr:beta-ketoacyl synthase chain length factor [Flavobacteriales bacterium]